MHPVQHAILIAFLFAFGASIGSFLNVVVWRLPRGKSLVSPGSHCPKCQHPLAWYDNIPVFGWIFLRGKCRYCSVAISSRYPIVEFVTGALFVFFYAMFFIYHVSPCAPATLTQTTDVLLQRTVDVQVMMDDVRKDWPVFLLSLFMVACLIAISLIDAELYIIPLSIPWLMAGVGMFVHALIDNPHLPGAVMVTDPTGMSGALAAGGMIGLGISLLLYRFGVIPQSFPEGEPALEIDDVLFAEEVERAKAEGLEPPLKPRDYTRKEIRAEIRKEIIFLMPPMLGGLAFVAATQFPPLRDGWRSLLQYDWLAGLLGSVLGALVGALVVWAARIFGTLAFGRVAMGLGDVHLMFGCGAVVGAGAAVVAFFLAPFAGILVGLYGFLFRKKHELPYGPYLSLATVDVLICYCPIKAWMGPGMEGLAAALQDLVGLR